MIMEIRELKKQLNNNIVGKLYLFYGPEEFLKKYYIDSVKEIALTGSLTQMNYIVLEGKVDIDRIKDNCDTVPIFSEKKIVIVKNSGLLKSGKKGDASEALLLLMQDLPDYTCLIFYEDEIDKRIKPVKYIFENGAAVEFPYQKERDLVKWVMKVVNSYKKNISPSGATYLVEYSEQGMTEILNEIEKLIAYVGDNKKIDESDIEKVCTKSISGRIFDLTDAAVSGDGEKAIELLDNLITLREPVQKIQFMISRQLLQLYNAKLLLDNGVSTGLISKKLGVSPYVCNKILRIAGNYSRKQLEKALKRSLEADVGMKTGKIENRTAVEVLIAELSK